MTTPMTAERFEDRFRFYKAQEQQHRGVQQLHQAIAEGLPAEQILDEQAPWAVTFSSAPPAPPAPRHQQVVWIRGVQRKPEWSAPSPRHRLSPATPTCWSTTGTRTWRPMTTAGPSCGRCPVWPAARGPTTTGRHTSTDTPPGLYRLGQLYPDYEQNPNPPCSDTAMSYGWYSFDMEELEGQEVKVGRAGIMLHGGGSGCGWPGAWAPTQPLLPTLGCVRLHNIDLRDKVLPLYRQGNVYVGVFQEP